MTDAWEGLGWLGTAPGTSLGLDLVPDPAFTATLRNRLEGLLLQPTAPAVPTAPGGAMPITHQISPYLAVADARAALAFYAEAFGAVPRGQVYEMEDGRIGHAEVLIGETVLMLADEYPEIDLLGPLARGGSTTSLHLTVPDVDAVVARAVAAGATLEREVADAPYGRTGVVLDPAGHRWMVQTPPPTPDAGAATGAGEQSDVGYQTLYAPDVERTKSFFAAVLGWTYVGGDAQGGWEAEGVRPQTGLMGGAARPEVQLCFRVDDARDGVRRVREAGGTAQEPEDKPYGLLAECTDDQGMRFQLWQPR
jgi:uncharacterized glyoxalase superfamily protein PhnB